jgi:DNA-nicking Smr family endonuclease
MRDVEKIRGRNHDPSAAPVTKAIARKPTPSRAKRPGAPSVKSASALPVLAAGVSADVDARTLDRLRRGRLQPEARLDLHGLTQDKAHRALDRFISRARSSNMRCIIIITGKGRVSEGGGVLRNQVPQWLNAPGIRPGILAFSPAQPRDGGAGALYVLLRKQR